MSTTTTSPKLLSDLGITKDDDSISVTLAPIYGNKPVTIKDVRID